MSEWLVYSPREQINPATSYYIETVLRAGRALGRKPRYVDSLRYIPWQADVFLVDCKSAFKLRAARPLVRYWLWMQGIFPEEARLQFDSRWREILWNYFERCTLPNARGVLLVSHAMRRHFERKYGNINVPLFIMPCANSSIDPASFEFPLKYENPRFVYAGSMSRWQCFELTLDVYKRIKAQVPQATLTVFTAQQAEAKKIVDASDIKDVNIDFVPLDQLQRRLAQFKYGFVLRAPHIVNNVATPTKVSSYMAAGVIPVMTAAVEDYVKALESVYPMVVCKEFDAAAIAQAVINLEERELHSSDILHSYSAVFDRYFDHAIYAAPLESFLQSTGLGTATNPHVG